MVHNTCEASVKGVVKGFHTKCCYDRPVVQVLGNDINTALCIANFESNKKYRIYHYLHRQKLQPTLKRIQDQNLKIANEIPNVL